MRHAKSSWTQDVADHERPLSGRGRRDGLAAGSYLAEHEVLIDLVLCSTAVRTRQTWDRLVRGGARARQIRYLPELYQATPQAVLTSIRKLAETPGSAPSTVLLIGHNPELAEVVALLARRRDNDAWWESMDRKFPTSAMATIRFANGWAEVDPGRGDLVDYQVHRGARINNAS